MAYALHRLGFLQFQQVCAALLHLEAGVDPDGWEGSADHSRAALSATPLGPPLLDRALPGPVLVQCAWVRDQSRIVASDAPPAEELLARVDTLRGERPDEVASLALITNLSPSGGFPGKVGPLAAAVIGPERLSERIDARPELRLRFPSLLGLRDLTPLIDPALAERSTLDRAAADALAAVFVPTAAYVRALQVLTRHHFTVLTGPPEMGKTAIARTLALALHTDGWEAHECTRPEQLFAALDPARRQVFVADDAFGSTEYRPDAAARWSREMERILRALDDSHWLIWTSRPAPLRAGLDRLHRERGAERFPAPGEVLVDAGRLSPQEKALILFRHAKAAALPLEVRDAVRHAGPAIVGHRHFTPERIRRLVARLDGASTDITDLAEEELSQASEAMVTSFTALAVDQRELLIAMLDSAPGPTGERELAATVRRHHPGGLPRPVAELLDRLTDHFLRIEERRVSWVHPSWRDLVIEQLRVDGAARLRFLRACGIHGALLALSHGGGTRGERTLPLLVADADWDALTDRVHALVPELDAPDLIALLDATRRAHATRGTADRAETSAFAASLLARVTSVWGKRVLPLPELEAWLALGSALPDRPAPPPLGVTWTELLPAHTPDLDDRAAVERMIDWLTLVELLWGYDRTLIIALPRTTAALHVEGYLDALDGQLTSGRWSLDAELSGRAVATILRVLPNDPSRLRRLQTWLRGPDPDVPTEYPLPEMPASTALDIGRVLRDL